MLDMDETISKFMDNHRGIFDEVKWCLIIDSLNAVEGPEEVRQQLIDFVTVFRRHKVDPDIVVEALSVLGKTPVKEEKKPEIDISEEELTNFVEVLNKLRKKSDDNSK